MEKGENKFITAQFSAEEKLRRDHMSKKRKRKMHM